MNRFLTIELRALGRAVLLSLILCVLSATVVYFSGLSETLLPSLGKVILIVSVFLAGCQVSKYYGSRGLLRGISMGIICFILLLITTLIFNASLIAFKTFVYALLICLVSGGLGGILGIGLSDK